MGSPFELPVMYEIVRLKTSLLNGDIWFCSIVLLYFWMINIIIIIIIKAIYNMQDPPKAANELSASEKVWLSIYNVSYKQQCLQLCPKGRETTVRHSQ